MANWVSTLVKIEKKGKDINEKTFSDMFAEENEYGDKTLSSYLLAFKDKKLADDIRKTSIVLNMWSDLDKKPLSLKEMFFSQPFLITKNEAGLREELQPKLYEKFELAIAEMGIDCEKEISCLVEFCRIVDHVEQALLIAFNEVFNHDYKDAGFLFAAMNTQHFNKELVIGAVNEPEIYFHMDNEKELIFSLETKWEAPVMALDTIARTLNVELKAQFKYEDPSIEATTKVFNRGAK